MDQFVKSMVEIEHISPLRNLRLGEVQHGPSDYGNMAS
jgi:hypothetical protein